MLEESCVPLPLELCDDDKLTELLVRVLEDEEPVDDVETGTNVELNDIEELDVIEDPDDIEEPNDVEELFDDVMLEL